MAAPDGREALDHVVVVMFENRSFTTFSAGCMSPVRWTRSRASPARS
jgi:hypothetical protein